MKARRQYGKIPMLAVISLLALAACTNQTNDPSNMQSGGNELHAEHHHLQDPGIIPSYDGMKTQTTNEHGNTVSNMGMSVYSLIGSSSLHEGGVSSHVHSRLTSLGIDDVKVFVLNDTVILARAGSQMSANRYDGLQKKVLSPMEGMSGKGDPEGVGSGEASNGDSLAQAEEQVKKMFNEDVQILSITNPEAPELIDQIASKLHDSPRDASIAQDIAALLQLTSTEKAQQGAEHNESR